MTGGVEVRKHGYGDGPATASLSPFIKGLRAALSLECHRRACPGGANDREKGEKFAPFFSSFAPLPQGQWWRKTLSEQRQASRRRFGFRCIPWAGLVLLLGVSGCDRSEPEVQVPVMPTAIDGADDGAVDGVCPSPNLYPSIMSGEESGAVLEAYLQAWKFRRRHPEVLTAKTGALLEQYGRAYDAVLHLAGKPGFDPAIRRLWDYIGLARATALSPRRIKEAVHWRDHALVVAQTQPLSSLMAAARKPILLRLRQLPEAVLDILAGVRPNPDREETYLDVIRARVDAVYLTAQLVEWSPGCPMEVCGSAEPLTRTAIVIPASYSNFTPKPAWSAAAVLVHESAHIAWFHRAEVAAHPALLAAVPDERNAWCETAVFLRALLRSSDPSFRGRFQGQVADIQTMLQRACDSIRTANATLGLDPEDESRRFVAVPEKKDTPAAAVPASGGGA